VFCGERGKREKVGALLILLSFAKREIGRQRELDITTRTIRQQKRRKRTEKETDPKVLISQKFVKLLSFLLSIHPTYSVVRSQHPLFVGV